MYIYTLSDRQENFSRDDNDGNAQNNHQPHQLMLLNYVKADENVTDISKFL